VPWRVVGLLEPPRVFVSAQIQQMKRSRYIGGAVPRLNERRQLNGEAPPATPVIQDNGND